MTPQFRVERETLGEQFTVDEIEALVPEFQPSDLSDHHRKFYDAVRDMEFTHGPVVEKPGYVDAEVGETVGMRDMIESVARALYGVAKVLREYSKADD
jgi:hypothetical protein